ncbi:uncharacterized protein EAF01_010045 [Botrytis porri]|uniref:Uncharacterized protein n=1 Tax=Botrytis porri TaxID=87229 RepID=A0A4Z1KS39_9HELO|nr:uncharacterized protein EAF01_010045 [Botrytis porri]KAF7894595.1 hypothetical protein EAF01_010045 [Botrytis porri]TGO85249.1 hypothetical protein BPOR_0416g00090 [Botrytis porri]
MDSTTRFEHAVQSLQAVILDKLEPSLDMLQALKDWAKVFSKQMIYTHKVSKRQYSDSTGVAQFFLGTAGERMYCHVRNELHIPFVDEEYLEFSEWLPDTPNSYQSIGSMVTAVYESMRSVKAVNQDTEKSREPQYCRREDTFNEPESQVGERGGGNIGDEWKDVKEEIGGLVGEGERDEYEFMWI